MTLLYIAFLLVAIHVINITVVILLQIVSVNPGLTDTNMVPSMMKLVFGRLMYSADASSYSTLMGLFSGDLVGGEYLSNTVSPFFGSFVVQQYIKEPGPNSSTLSKMLWKKLLILRGIGSVLLQNVLYSSPRIHPVNSVLTVDSLNGTDITKLSEVTEKLYEWSLEAVKQFRIE